MSAPLTTVIGLDAASDRANFGFAIGSIRGSRVEIEEAGCLQSGRRASGFEAVVAHLRSLRTDVRVLVAIDAPLGWPAPLGEFLTSHVAGSAVREEKSALFRRATDLRVRALKHSPLEVGADRIARAAVEALKVLQDLREATGLTLPLAWDTDFAGAAAIEVYPAATLRQRGIRSVQYKKKDQVRPRDEIAQALAGDLAGIDRYVDGSADIFDACICLVCAHDFLLGRCESPASRQIAEKEGWIWLAANERDA